MLTPEDVKKRIVEFTVKRDEANKMALLFEGAIQDCEWVLAQLQAAPAASTSQVVSGKVLQMQATPSAVEGEP